MAAGDLSLAIIITAQNQASNVIAGIASALGPVGVGIAAIGAVALVAGGAAVKMAGNFQSATTTLVTGAGESVQNLELVRQGILNIAVDTGTSTDKLVKAAFLIESAGYRGSQGLQVLRVAAEGAKVGNADLAQVADVLTTTLHNYGLSAQQAVPVTNSLIVTVQNGKMVMDDLNQSLTKVLPVAGALHVPLSSVEGALSTMAISGDKGAAAGTHLAMMLKMLSKPTGAASKEMAKMNIDSIKLAQTMGTSLPDALKMIQDAVGKHFVPGSVEYNRAIASILGGSKSGIAGLEIMGGNFSILQANVNAAANALKNGGNAVQGWSMVQQDFNFKMDRAKEVLETFAIRVGTALLPVLGNLVNWIVSNVVPALTRFGDYIQTTIIPALQRFGAWIQENILPALRQMGTFFLNNILPVLKQIGTFLLGTFIPVWQQLVNTWKNQLWPLIQMLLPVLKIIGIVILGIVVVAVLFLIGVFILTIEVIIHVIQIVAWLISAIGDGFHRMGQTITDFKNLVGNTFNAIGTFIHDKIVWIYNHNYYVKAFVDNAMKFLHNLQVGVVAVFNFIKLWIQQKLAEVQILVEVFKSVIGNKFSQLGTSIHQKITDAWNWLKGFVSGWPSQAVQWGINLIQGFINGIGSQIGNVKNVAHNVVSSIAGFLGFHSPTKEGPGRDADKWAPAFITMYTQGLLSGIPKVRAAFAQLTNPMTSANGAFSLSTAHSQSFALSGSQPIVVQVQPQSATIELNGRKVGESVTKYQGKAVRIVGGYRNA